MTELKIKTDTILISLATSCDIQNITKQINQKVIESTIENGIINIYTKNKTVTHGNNFTGRIIFLPETPASVKGAHHCFSLS